jgi:hypothetical protein
MPIFRGSLCCNERLVRFGRFSCRACLFSMRRFEFLLDVNGCVGAGTRLGLRVWRACRDALCVGAASLGLVACAPGSSAILDTVGHIVPRSGSPEFVLVPGVDYLRVNADGRMVLLAKAFTVPYEMTWGTAMADIWFSAEKETLTLAEGRLVSTGGLSLDWRRVRYEGLPDWHTVMASHGEFHYWRERDVMPGYRYGIREQMRLARIAPDKSARPMARGEDVQWFEESVVSSPAENIPPTRYAVRSVPGSQPTVVAGNFCLSPSLCFRWERLPRRMAPAAPSAQALPATANGSST